MQLQQEKNGKEQSTIKKNYWVDHAQSALLPCLSILADRVWNQRSCCIILQRNQETLRGGRTLLSSGAIGDIVFHTVAEV